LIGETQKEDLKEKMKKIILSPWLLCFSVALMVYGLFAIIYGINYLLNSPAYTEGLLIAAVGLGVFLGRHEVAIAFIREDLKYIKDRV